MEARWLGRIPTFENIIKVSKKMANANMPADELMLVIHECLVGLVKLIRFFNVPRHVLDAPEYVQESSKVLVILWKLQ